MIQADYHLHTCHSGDSSTPMEHSINAGFQAGLTAMCFTEHMDYDFDPDCMENFILDAKIYQDDFLRCKEKYQGQMELHFGVELGLQPHIADKNNRFIESFPFEFVIGSSHIIDGMDPYYPKFQEGKTYDECLRKYFESIINNIKAFDNFDVYGHMDYIVRYLNHRPSNYDFKNYQDYIDTILKMLIEKGKGIEVNTGGFKAGLGHPNPHEAILKRYKELGGEILTIGSDAHVPEYVAYEFRKIPSILTEVGFSYYTIFKERKPVFLPLE